MQTCRSYPQLRFLRFVFFHLGDATKYLVLERCRIETVAGVSILEAIGDGNDIFHIILQIDEELGGI